MKLNLATLGEIVADDRGLIQTGPFGSQLHQSDYTEEGIPLIMPTNISDGRVETDGIARVSEETADRMARHKLKPRTIVLPRRGEITKRAFIRNEEDGWLCGSGCLKIEVQDSEVLPEYLYYFMATHETCQWLEQHAVGSTMLNLSAGIVNQMPVLYPTKKKQECIAETLTAYDDLIENNRRRIVLLEESARLLYREWFVRLRFPGHEHTRTVNGVPEGWQRRTLGDALTLKRGYDLPANDRIDGPIPIISSSGITGYHCEKKCDPHGIVTGRYGTLGQVYFIQEPFWPLNTALYVSDFKETPAAYAALLLEFSLAGTQSDKAAIPGLNRNVAHRLPVLWPPKLLRDEFNEFALLGFEQSRVLSLQNQKLRTARDLLLPKLMSGEIEV